MNDINKIMLLNEQNYSCYATKNNEAIRIKKQKKDFRPEYYRDIDRIIYTLSYNRYMDKTQVFSLNKNDHLSRRMTHVQFVSKIARTIGRALQLNEDLIEAIALGHDIGHSPIGHVGEKILNKISLENNCGKFMHNVQSVRTLMILENNGLGSNLTIQTLDGILCHNGEGILKKIEPIKKTKEEFLKQYQDSYTKNIDLNPMTLEGCVVKISDVIGYLGRDLEDAIRIKILKQEEIPREITDVLGKTNKEIINNIVMDIIENSQNKPYIKLSDKIYNAIKKLIEFNYKHIYHKANTKEDIEEYEKKFRKIFSQNLENLKNKNTNSNIYKHFIKNMDKSYLKTNTKERIVIDYISGMTDDYFLDSYKE